MRLPLLSSSVAGFVLATVSLAHADTFTSYDTTNTFSSGGKITGTVTLDDTTGVWTAANLTTANFVASNEQFTEVQLVGNDIFMVTAVDPSVYILFRSCESLLNLCGTKHHPPRGALDSGI